MMQEPKVTVTLVMEDKDFIALRLAVEYANKKLDEEWFANNIVSGQSLWDRLKNMEKKMMEASL